MYQLKIALFGKTFVNLEYPVGQKTVRDVDGGDGARSTSRTVFWPAGLCVVCNSTKHIFYGPVENCGVPFNSYCVYFVLLNIFLDIQNPNFVVHS